MDTLYIIIKLAGKDCFTASIDLKDAYYSLSIAKSDSKYAFYEGSPLSVHMPTQQPFMWA